MFDLELGLEANPFPENATWSFNGQILPMISGIELGVNFIRIQMVTPLDEGSYTVQTSNSVGMDMVSFQLQVEGIHLVCNVRIISTELTNLSFFPL